MLAFNPHLAMLATFCSLLAVTILPASTIAAALVESEGFNLLGSDGIYENIIGGSKRGVFEKDDKRNEQLGVPGTIQLKSLEDGHATALVLNNYDGDEKFFLAESDGTSGTPIFLVQVHSTPLDFSTPFGVAVFFRVAPFTTSDHCVTANLDTARSGSPFTVEPCSDFKVANAHKTQVFRYNKQTGVIQALRPTTSSNGSTPSNDAPTGPYRGRTLRFVPGVPKTKDAKDSSLSADATTVNTATEAEAETETSAQSGSSTSTQ